MADSTLRPRSSMSLAVSAHGSRVVCRVVFLFESNTRLSSGTLWPQGYRTVYTDGRHSVNHRPIPYRTMHQEARTNSHFTVHVGLFCSDARWPMPMASAPFHMYSTVTGAWWSVDTLLQPMQTARPAPSIVLARDKRASRNDCIRTDPCEMQTTNDPPQTPFAPTSHFSHPSGVS